jgi:FlaA1/EpsC-like NDP-sugar epimerase
MVRFFMTVPEATRLALQAVSLGKSGVVYVLDMGEPVRIEDLARDLIRLSGLEIGVDIDIVYTGMRPGERLYEELLTAEEGTVSSMHDRIYVARQSVPAECAVRDLLGDLFEAASRRDADCIRAIFEALVPTYHPNGHHG